MSRLLCALLVAILALPVASAAPADQAAQRRAERAALRQKLRAHPGEWVRDRDRWVPVRPGLCDATSCGTVRVGKVGSALVLRVYVPEDRGGTPGFAVHQLVKAVAPARATGNAPAATGNAPAAPGNGPAATGNAPAANAGAKHGADEAKVKQAFLQTVKYASNEFLRAEPLATLYAGALAGVARSASVEKSELLRDAMDGLAGCLNDRYTCYFEPRAAKDWADRSKPVQVGAGFRLEVRSGGSR